MDGTKHLIELSETPGVSGHEARIREVIQAAWAGLADEFATDALGNLIATRHGTDKAPRRRALVTAHMDEIGLMVTKIDGAFLRVTSVGGIDRRVLLSQPVTVHGARDLPGLIGSRPPHLLSESQRGKVPAYDDLVVDCGLPHKELEALVPIGSLVTFGQTAVTINDHYVSGKAMDNRASCAALTLLLHELQGRSHAWDVLIAATVQEEVTLAGGHTVAYQTQPDLAIVLDTTWGIGSGVNEEKGFALGEGPTLLIGPNAHPSLFDLLRDTAKEIEIPLTPEAAPGGSGTEGMAIQISREGVPVAILGIPIRNMHTPVEMVDMKDIERVARLVAEFVCGLDQNTLEKLALDQ
jgi:endoglucanase